MRFREAWEAYVAVNEAFAEAIADAAAPKATIVLVQDYQLALVAAQLRELRPDLRIVHFTHTPFCGPDDIRVLPDDVAEALCALAGRRPGRLPHRALGRTRTGIGARGARRGAAIARRSRRASAPTSPRSTQVAAERRRARRAATRSPTWSATAS